MNYYKFYKNPYNNQQLRSNIEFNITDGIKFTLKPYFWKGRGSGTSATVDRNKIYYRESYNYTDRPGFIADLSFSLPYNSNINIGYWYERANLKQWQPSFLVTVNKDGTYRLSFDRYNYIQKTITTTNSIYLFLENKNLMDRFDLNLGLRYANVKREYTSYSTKGMPYYPEDGVYDDPKLTKDNNLSYTKTYRKLLPNFGVGFKVLDGVYGYFAYARNFRVPQNSAPGFTFSLPKGVTAQYIADQLKPEEADSFDLGIRYNKGNFYVVPLVYYVNYKNRLVRVADPTNPNLTYLRNVGKVEAKGFELEIGAVPLSSVSVYASFSYNTAKFKEDYIVDGNNRVYIKDKEVPDTPKYMFKVGANIRIESIRTNIYPSLQYVGSRYGNFTNTEKIGSYTIVNLSINTRISRNFTFYADIVNLFDKKYIGRISPGFQSGTYYVAAPFTISAGIKAQF